MGFNGMGQTRKRAWLVAVIWMVAGIGFGLTFFMGGGPGTLPDDSLRHFAGAGALAFGFLGYWFTLFFTRKRRGGPLLADERDFQILARANQATLVVVLLGIFVFTISLWTVYESGGQVQVGWMWFLAYGSVILTFVMSAVTTLILERSTGDNG